MKKDERKQSKSRSGRLRETALKNIKTVCWTLITINLLKKTTARKAKQKKAAFFEWFPKASISNTEVKISCLNNYN